MSDRSYSSFTVPLVHADDAEKRLAGWECEEHPEQGCIVFSDGEADWGGASSSEDLRLFDIPYHHQWSSGHSFTAGQEIFVPGEGCEEAVEDGPVARVGPRGAVNKKEVACAIKFHRLKRLFGKLCEKDSHPA